MNLYKEQLQLKVYGYAARDYLSGHPADKPVKIFESVLSDMFIKFSSKLKEIVDGCKEFGILNENMEVINFEQSKVFAQPFRIFLDIRDNEVKSGYQNLYLMPFEHILYVYWNRDQFTVVMNRNKHDVYVAPKELENDPLLLLKASAQREAIRIYNMQAAKRILEYPPVPDEFVKFDISLDFLKYPGKDLERARDMMETLSSFFARWKISLDLAIKNNRGNMKTVCLLAMESMKYYKSKELVEKNKKLFKFKKLFPGDLLKLDVEHPDTSLGCLVNYMPEESDREGAKSFRRYTRRKKNAVKNGDKAPRVVQ